MVDTNKLLHFYTLKNLTRFASWFRIKDESVAEHSYFVALFTLLICKDLDIDIETTYKALGFAIIHDIPEIYTADIPHTVKEEFPFLVKDLFKAEIESMRKILPDYVEFFKEIHNGIDKRIKLIVQLADVLSVMQYAALEIALGSEQSNFLLDDGKKRYEELQNKIYELFGKRVNCFEL